MTLITSRRSLLLGLGTTLVAAPAIVRASSLMKVKAPKLYTVKMGSYDHVVYYFDARHFYIYTGNERMEISWSDREDIASWEPIRELE